MANTKQKNKYSYDLVVDGIPYQVEVVPYLYNDQKRFFITVNGEGEHVYVWDEEVVQLRAIDDSPSDLPDTFEKELSDRLVKTIIL